MTTTSMSTEEREQIDKWVEQVITRFFNMAEAGVDTVGLKKAKQMATRYYQEGYITPGEFQYLWDRTHPTEDFILTM
jgi:hypothetical protein